MGRGNWRPVQDSDRYSLRYFDLNTRYGVDCDPDTMWSDFYDEIRESLPKSFYRVERKDRVDVSDLNRRNTCVLFQNDLVCICMDSHAFDCHVGIAFVVLDDDAWDETTYRRNFGPKYMDQLAKKFWQKMGGEQFVRTSAWTSALVK